MSGKERALSESKEIPWEKFMSVKGVQRSEVSAHTQTLDAHDRFFQEFPMLAQFRSGSTPMCPLLLFKNAGAAHLSTLCDTSERLSVDSGSTGGF